MSLSLIATLALPAWAKRLGGNVDVCSIRPDLCDDQAPQRTKRRAPRVRGLDAETLSLASVRGNPARTAAKAAAQKPAAAKRAHRTPTCRPSTVEINEQNHALPECGQAGRTLASVNARRATVSFGSYMNHNADNPALSRQSISDYQTAFADTSKPATLDVTRLVDGTGVREGTSQHPQGNH